MTNSSDKFNKKIPTSWELRSVSEIAETTAGGTPSTTNASFWNGDIRWMNSGELHKKRVFEVEGRITKEGLANSSTKIIPKYSVLIGLAGQGKTRGTVAINMVELCTNQSIASIFPSKHFIPEYLFYNLDLRYEELRKLSTGAGGRGGLNLKIINSLKVLLPPLPEQQAIAEVLSDMDNLIQAQEALIEKKKLIKQGVMQELLTGKRRLPGFVSRWENKFLGEISNISTGKRNNEDKVENGDFPFFVRSQNVERINSFSFDGEAILIPGEGGIGTIIHFIKGKFDYHQRVYKISNFSEGVFAPFVYYFMKQFFFSHATSFSVKATVDSLRLPAFLNFVLSIPTFDEQKGIANLLLDIDEEVNLMESELVKLLKLKQGMMQALLTGKIRLV